MALGQLVLNIVRYYLYNVGYALFVLRLSENKTMSFQTSFVSATPFSNIDKYWKQTILKISFDKGFLTNCVRFIRELLICVGLLLTAPSKNKIQ